MLTESVSDPRRANWLTISMAEDLYWPEDGNARPAWELEAEILRLTTRLMMRERELGQAKNQLKIQTTKAQQQAAIWRKRMEDKEEQMRVLLIQKDAEMQNIVSQLLLFEAELRQEQRRIEDLLAEKDVQILSQQKEIQRLKRGTSPSTVRRDDQFREKESWSTEHSIPDLVNVDCRSVDDSMISSWKMDHSSNSSEKDSRKTQDSNASIMHRHRSSWKAEDSVLDSINVDYDALEDSTRSSWKMDHSNHSSEKESGQAHDSRKNIIDINRSSWKIDNHIKVDSQDAVRKLKNGLTKIRAIQDVTNVKSLSNTCDILPVEKKKVPSKAPQKMKDLKAKRINHHKVHRSVMSEISGQAVL
ncbi:uncharacterized protein LOC129230704 [Uloborus diversus]|uniref:uncharacterized protein LOC129230704 n=1 Tax=Uloborus diversus TaxID=327109 RepID=UPI002409CAF1|nr:uncharacterized protein LOC129230704 [Uloborus diversus]